MVDNNTNINITKYYYIDILLMLSLCFGLWSPAGPQGGEDRDQEFSHNQQKENPHLSTIAGKLEFSDERNRSEDLRRARINEVLSKT